MYGPHLAECTEKNQAKAKSMLSHSRCTMWDTGRKKKKKGVSHAVYSKVESYISEKKVVSTRGCCAIAMAADGGQAFTPEA